MCDLSQPERDAILGHVNGLEELVARLRTSTQSIEDRNWMDHEEMDELLAQLAEKANQTQSWVHRKMAMTH